MADISRSNSNFYPTLEIPRNLKPNRWLAIPFIGFLIRFILIIPVGIWLLILSFAYLVVWMIVPFVILFTGKYWEEGYKFIVGYLTLYTKLGIYLFGLTDKYPGFEMADNGIFKLHIAKPEKPNRLLGFPVLGIIIRAVLIFPYAIYEYVLSSAAQIALFITWFAVLFKGNYPERFHLFIHDYLRVNLAEAVYTSYLSDKYPSFKISTKYKSTVIALIIGGILLIIGNAATQPAPESLNDTDSPSLEESFDYPQGY